MLNKDEFKVGSIVKQPLAHSSMFGSINDASGEVLYYRYGLVYPPSKKITENIKKPDDFVTVLWFKEDLVWLKESTDNNKLQYNRKPVVTKKKNLALVSPVP